VALVVRTNVDLEGAVVVVVRFRYCRSRETHDRRLCNAKNWRIRLLAMIAPNQKIHLSERSAGRSTKLLLEFSRDLNIEGG